MSNINDGGPAFGAKVGTGRMRCDEAGNMCERTVWANGMSLRDWFAGQALVGIWSSGDVAYAAMSVEAKKLGEARMSQTFAREAYEAADAMLAERAKKGTQ